MSQPSDLLIVDIPYNLGYIFLGIDVDKLFDDLKAYREQFAPTVMIYPLGAYDPLFRETIYRYCMRDDDVGLFIIAHIAPDAKPMFLLQPIIYDTAHESMDKLQMSKRHCQFVQDAVKAEGFTELSKCDQFIHHVSTLKNLNQL